MIEQQDSVADNLECIIWNALDDSMEYGWNTSDGAKAIVAALAETGVIAAIEAQGWRDAPEQAASCPKCSLKAEMLLHKFCTHQICPVRNAAQNQ